MRQIVFDTETTGLNPATGDRLVEIGAVELQDLMPTGKEFHAYINPEREVGADAERIHGLSTQFLADKPIFSKIAEDFIAFVGDADLVAHNANFDAGFLNSELKQAGYDVYESERFIDTLVIARKLFPRASNTLDALCKRYDIDIAHRDLHGALKDARLLADVYLELKGGRQRSFEIDSQPDAAQSNATMDSSKQAIKAKNSTQHAPYVLRATEQERQLHQAAQSNLKDPVWNEQN